MTFATVRLESEVVYLLERGYSWSVLGRKVFLCMCPHACGGGGGVYASSDVEQFYMTAPLILTHLSFLFFF